MPSLGPQPPRRPPPPPKPAKLPKSLGPVTEAEAVAHLLADRDFPCRQCGYNLRGAAGNRCPECGTQISRSSLQFKVAHWNTPAFYVGVLGIVTGYAPAIVAGVVIARAFFVVNTIDKADNINIFLLFVWAAALIKLLMAWVNWASTMAAWSRWRHWMTAGACWLLPLIGAGIAWRMGTWYW